MNKLNVGVVGCGAIGPIHMHAIKEIPYAHLYAICDINEQKVKELASKENCKYYTDFEEMLGDEEIQVIHICTPHYLHYPMVCRCLEKGKHVFTEKPLGLNGRECEVLRDLAEASNYKAGVCLQNRLNPTSRALKEIIDQETYRKILGMRAFVSWYRSPEYYQLSNWRGKWQYEGGGLLMNQMVHTLDLMQWLGGKVTQIKGHASNRVLGEIIEEEDTAEAIIWFESGARGHFYGTNTYSTNSSVLLEIHVEQGILRIQDQELYFISNDQKVLIAADSNATEGKDYLGKSHGIIIAKFYEAIKENHNDYMKIKEGVNAVMMCKAIYKDSGIE